MLLTGTSIAQEKRLPEIDRFFQFSLFPGIGTNGIHSGHYLNKFSINLFGGVSAGSTRFEIAGISNLSLRRANSFQIAGFANVVGSNSFHNLTLREERSLIKNGFTSDFKGVQIAGLLNYVRNNVEGIQIAGGLNIANGYSSGLLVAGLANMVGGHHLGVQIAGLYNVAVDGVVGTQISVLYNYTKGQSTGLQLGLVNKSIRMKGKNSFPRGGAGIQVGLVNITKETAGTQIGLINIGTKARGKQIGLINIFKRSPYLGGSVGNNNTPIGLINIGSKGSHIRVYSNELFLTVAEKTTGSCYNCTPTKSGMPLTGLFQKMHQNAIIVAYNPWKDFATSPRWGVGYGFVKVMYNKSSMLETSKLNKKRFISLGGRVLHLNRTDKIDTRLSLLGKLHAEFGIRPSAKPSNQYVFIGFSVNSYFHNGEDLPQSLEVFARKESGLNYQLWPGYTVGLQL